jgi:hypothetical protein
MKTIISADDLKAKHPTYDKYVDEWERYKLVYEGGDALIDDTIEQNPRESTTNFNNRVQEAYAFNYARAIVDLFNFYLTAKEPIRRLDGLAKDSAYQLFERDCDLYGTGFNLFMNEAQKLASVYGAIGILVTKPGSVETRAEEQELKLYPYLCPYTLLNIYDWEYARHPVTGRPELIYLKLKEAEEDEYLIWTKTSWERWQIQEGEGGTNEAVMMYSSVNTIGEIPFIWMQNISSLANRLTGISDMKESARIVQSIIRNLSCGEEIIKWAAFPMMRVPMKAAGDEEEPQSGPTAVWEFDPEHGEGGKPDWMESVVGEPIEAVLRWIDRKVDELFRLTHLSGVHGQRRSNNEVASGLALQYEFQQLNAVLEQKSRNMNIAELGVLRYWLMWQNDANRINNIEVLREKNFSVLELSNDLSNMQEAAKTVLSDTFQKLLQSRVAKRILPDLTEHQYSEIEKEIDGNVDVAADLIAQEAGQENDDQEELTPPED